MTTNPDSFGAKGTLEVGDNSYQIYRIGEVEGSRTLPYSLKVLLENLLRTEDGTNTTAEDIRALAAWDAAALMNAESWAMLTWAPMLEPPNWQSFQSVSPKLLIQRRMTHGWDLGKWFTQPCLIVVGQLAEAECPVPIYVDGERAASKGRTVVRWIYPLTPNPVSPPGDAEQE